jgi:hypothetical protein
MKFRRRNGWSKSSLVLLGVACCVAWSSPLHAQRASLLGVVSDQKGGPIPGVNVTLLNLDQGLKREATTNEAGYFSVPLLQPGPYLITAQKDGFAVAEIRDVVLHVGDIRGLNIELVVAAAPEQIQVTSQAHDVETVSATLGEVITGDVIRNAPLNGRDVRALALLQPGVVVADTDFRGAGGFNIVGSRADSINYLLDGGLNNDLIDNRAVYTPNPDTISEYRILTSNYPAEFGRNAGGVITMATQSGTNQLHGSLFDFFRNDALNANSYFNKINGLPRPVYKRNQFGGTLGGPITIPGVVEGKDRYFFFVGYQGHRQVQALTEHGIGVFTPQELNGDFSASNDGNPDPNVAAFLQANPFFQPDPAKATMAIIDPTRINSVAQNYIAQGLIPTSPTGELNSEGRFTFDRDEITSKVDLDLDRSNKLGVTFGVDWSNQLTPFDYATVPGFSDVSDFQDYFGNVNYTHIFSPTLLNEAWLTVQRVYSKSENPAVDLPKPSDLGIAITPDLPTGPTNLYFVDSNLLIGFSNIGPQSFADNTVGVSDSLTWVRGSHSVKLGGGMSAYQSNIFVAFNVNGQFVYLGAGGIGSQNALADFLLGLPLQFTQAPAANSNIRSRFYYGFAEDEWRARKNLVITYGLRYEYGSPKYDTAGRTFSIIPGLKSTVFSDAPTAMVFPGDAGAPRGVNFPDRNDWAPRLGFAWDPTGKGTTSLRGGFGMFYDILKAEDNLQFNGKPPFYSAAGFAFGPLAGNPAAEVPYMPQPYVASGVPDPFPSTPPPSNINFANAGFLPIGSSGSVFVVDPHLRTPYTYQYHLTLQHELAPNLVAQASYVGSSSHGLTGLTDVNPFQLGTFDRVLNLQSGNSSCTGSNPGACSYGALHEFKNITNANYNGLLLSLQKQLSGNGVFGKSYFTLAYTYSHNIDNASGFTNRNLGIVPSYQPELFRSSADMDVRNRIVFSGGWEVPVERAWNTGPKRLTQGWNLFPIISWRTGYPVDVFANLPSAFDFTSPGPSAAGDAAVVRANLVGPIRTFDPHRIQTFDGETGNYYFDPTSFSESGFPTDAQAVADPAVRTYGTLPRNYFRGPGQFNIDLAFSKVTPITDQTRLEFRADFFNLINNAQFYTPNTNISDQNFGKMQYTFQPRIIQLALRFSF